MVSLVSIWRLYGQFLLERQIFSFVLFWMLIVNVQYYCKFGVSHSNVVDFLSRGN